MWLLLDIIYAALVCVGWPLLVVRRWRRGPGSIALRDRLGDVPSRPVSAHCVWIHGVSLGEINATRTIVAELHRRMPDAAIVISSTTDTGLARARELYPRLTVFRFPLDFSFVLRRVFERLRPSAIVLMELEAWPNLVEIADARGVPVLIANGRVTSERSMRRFGWPVVRRIARRMFSKLRWVGAQDEAYAERFRLLGVPAARIEVVGSLKYDSAEVADEVPGQGELARQMVIDPRRALWVCGSTGPGEEALLLEAYRRLRERFGELQLAIVPRKPERFEEVARLIHEAGFACLRRSGAAPLVPADVPEPQAVFLGDTLGELRKFYALATVVFVGRTLVPMGGSDVMEVAGLGRPVLVGPYTENFAGPVELLLRAGAAIRVGGASELPDVVGGLLERPEACRRMGAAGQEAVLSMRGATRQTVDRVLGFLELV